MKYAFIGLDYIIDITHSEGKIASSAQEVINRDVIAKTNKALSIAKKNHWLSILVKVGFEPGYKEVPLNSPMFGKIEQLQALELGRKGTDFHPGIDIDLADIVINKPRISAFYSTRLEAILRANKIEKLIIAGVSTTWAVQATARDAHDRDYEVLILEEACASATKEEHNYSIGVLKRISRIITMDELERL